MLFFVHILMSGFFERAKGKEQPIPFELFTLSQDHTEKDIEAEIRRRGLVSVTEKDEVRAYVEQHPWTSGPRIFAGFGNFYFMWIISEKGIQSCLRDRTFGSQQEVNIEQFFLKDSIITWKAGTRFLVKRAVERNN
jgi:hypothetical protein